MSTLFKQIYRYTHPRAFRHNENLWPYVKISRAPTGEISHFSYKNKRVTLVPLSELKNSFTGKILLAATGPSVNDVPFETLPEMPTIGVNGAYVLNGKVKFSFYLIVDMGFIDNRTNIIHEIIKNEKLILFTTAHGIVRIIEKFSLNNIKCRLSIIEDISCKIYEPKIEDSKLCTIHSSNDAIFFDGKSRGFNTDIRYGIFDAGTVVYWALQMLLFLGFERIYIIGLDMNNFDQPRFYETSSEKLPSMLSQKLNDIIIPSFRHASQVMKNRNVNVFNLSMSSAIEDDIFKKVSHNEIH
ncbi:sugar glycosyltransferase [Erwinia sp. P7711]|uniref:sugar glycosyltransferase n=1 Tax=Erwinia sp. P7711 TaxID=3141451 RepID=UPI0031928189